jgi:hypothetical protein
LSFQVLSFQIYCDGPALDASPPSKSHAKNRPSPSASAKSVIFEMKLRHLDAVTAQALREPFAGAV